jgi:hypothetical protein
MAQVSDDAPLAAHGYFPEVVYRAFTHKEHMDMFLRGCIRFGALSVYRALEDDARRDNLEGISHLSYNGLDHHGAMPGTTAYALCCSVSLHALLKAKFGQYVLRIMKPRIFAERITDALVSRAEMFYEGVEGVIVQYTKGHRRDSTPRPFELIRLSYSQKPVRFAPDEEFRFVVIRKTLGEKAPEDYLTFNVTPVLDLLEPVPTIVDPEYSTHRAST